MQWYVYKQTTANTETTYPHIVKSTGGLDRPGTGAQRYYEAVCQDLTLGYVATRVFPDGLGKQYLALIPLRPS